MNCKHLPAPAGASPAGAYKLPQPMKNTLILITALLLPCSSSAQPAAARRVARPLLAAWSFDEPTGLVCRDASGQGHDAAIDSHTAAAVRRVPGLFGNALSFSQNHAVRLPGNLPLEGIEKISFSAWVAPAELGSYREIFRKEDGNDRLLFSFQNDGAIFPWA